MCAPIAGGKGFGRQLIEVLFPRAAAMDVHMMIAHIDSAAARIRFACTRSWGSKAWATFREVGKMHGGWLSVVAMQKEI